MKKTAVITGASSGIGLAFARKLAETHNLLINARNEKKLETLAATLGLRTGVEIAPYDLSEKATLETFEKVVKNIADLDLFINNAAFGTVGKFNELDIDKEMNQLDLNINALVRLSHTAANTMIKGGQAGAIINVSSVAGFQVAPYSAVYGASKAFVKSFSESLSIELKKENIKVQALCPGLTHTDFHQRANFEKDNLPDFLWQTADEVVDESLKALAADRVVCVPGLLNVATVNITRFLPEGLVSTLAERMMKESIVSDE